MNYLKAGSIAIITLGFFHLVTYIIVIASSRPSVEALQLMHDMEQFKIQLFGTHTFLKFHKGFSIMTGVLFIAFGVQNLVMAKATGKRGIVSLFIMSLTAAVVSACYFHLLATALLVFSAVCYLVALRKHTTG
jgi:hypothetical protein